MYAVFPFFLLSRSAFTHKVSVKLSLLIQNIVSQWGIQAEIPLDFIKYANYLAYWILLAAQNVELA